MVLSKAGIEYVKSGNIDNALEIAGDIENSGGSADEIYEAVNAHEVVASTENAEAVQEDIPDSDHAATQAAVQSGDISEPESGPAPKTPVVIKDQEKTISGDKSWSTDMEFVEGKKGSNAGGLYKDKVLGTLHYVKWPGEDRARMEALAASLYKQAGLYVPPVHVINFPDPSGSNGKVAVSSDWIVDSGAMTIQQMKTNKDVRSGFLVDAWLANWDVVGMGGDNIVTAPGGAAFRIDAGGSLVYRAQGGPKTFSSDVPEFHTMRNPSSSPQAARVFENLDIDELQAGIDALSGVVDEDIEAASSGRWYFEQTPEDGDQQKRGILRRIRCLAIQEALYPGEKTLLSRPRPRLVFSKTDSEEAKKETKPAEETAPPTKKIGINQLASSDRTLEGQYGTRHLRT